MPLVDALAIFGDGASSAEAVILGAVDREIRLFTVTQDVLFPARYHDYYLMVARAVERAIEEDRRETRSVAGETG
jgi:hypothetical protein